VITLPAPVANYLAADKAKDPERVARCFTSDARVHDEQHDYRGTAAIKSWKQDSIGKYEYTVEPLDASVLDDTVHLRARLSGTFPNSPVELNYTFKLANEKIAALEIA